MRAIVSQFASCKILARSAAGEARRPSPPRRRWDASIFVVACDMASSSDARQYLFGWCANPACQGRAHVAADAVKVCSSAACGVAPGHVVLTEGCISNPETTSWRDLVPKKSTAAAGKRRLGDTPSLSAVMDFCAISLQAAAACPVVLRVCSTCTSFVAASEDKRAKRGQKKWVAVARVLVIVAATLLGSTSCGDFCLGGPRGSGVSWPHARALAGIGESSRWELPTSCSPSEHLVKKTHGLSRVSAEGPR